MPQARFIVLLFSLLVSVNGVFAQEQTPSKKEIEELIFKASEYLNSAQFEKSLVAARSALRYATEINDAYLIANAYNAIAGNYDELSEADKAIFFYNKGLDYANKTDNDTLKNWLNNNLGNMYFFEKKEYEKGINFYKKSLQYSEKIADTTQLVFTKLNICWGYFDIGQFDKGKPYLDYINKYHGKYGDSTTIVALNLLNGMYFSAKNENKKAENFFLTAIKLGTEGKEKFDLSYSHEEYSKFLLKNGRHKEAYEHLAQFKKISDQLYDQDKLKKADIAGLNLELDEYKREIDKIEIEKESQALSLKKSQIIALLFFIILIVLLLLLYTLYKNNLFKKKANAELTLANEELMAANQKAEEASLLKTQFVSTISHELRTPLYGVVGITNMILDEHKELTNSPHLNSLKFSARYLLSLVNDILQINKIEEKRIVLETLTFNVPDEIGIITNSLEFIANKNENKVSIHVDETIPEFLIGDKLRFSQILMNLTSNALKFTKKGEVIISAKQVRVEGKVHFIEFSIKDNGVGIAKEDQAKIYDKFVQIGRKDDDYQGTGLGLSIVKRLIELFKSEIHLESQLNVGTTFSFTIGFESDAQKTQEIINNIEVDLTSSQILKVLVVEDNKINQMVTKKIIEKNNFKCDIVEDGFAAIGLVQKENYDIILMDINMPVINGFETTRRIRSLGITTPIVALTAFDKGEITEEAMSAGMNDIIIKPFEPVKLFQIINSQIIKRRNAGN
ncbi:response regulator [Flavobacterium sp.]|uniref:tetratricopeptide repeat-containing hybrid sensor histidine kinase/response regulator n=1 Tax=Flavobacterium sp. TaxID=239 RepID=UPI0039E2F113